MLQAISLSPIPQPRPQTGSNLCLKFPRLQRISLSPKSSGGHFVGPISNSSCGSVEWTRSCSVELQPVLALRAQHGLLTIRIPADFCRGSDGLQFRGTAQRSCKVYIQKISRYPLLNVFEFRLTHLMY